MRPAAEVEPVALIVDLEVLVLGDRVDQLDLVGLALVGERPCLALSRDQTSLVKGLLRRDDLAASSSRSSGRSSGVKGSLLGKIVVEAVLDHRADGHLRSGPQFLHGFGHHMRRVVADEFQRARVVAGDDLERAGSPTGSDRSRRSPSSAIATAFLASDLEIDSATSRPVVAGVIVADGTIGKCQGNGFGHCILLIQSRQRVRVVNAGCVRRRAVLLVGVFSA